MDDGTLSSEDRIQPPIEQWLAGFRDAKLIITDSFHACVFSIIFHKPFIVIGNRARGYSRFESLLMRMGLENRLLENTDQFDKSMLKPLSEDVYKKLNESKGWSMEYLKKALSH